MTARELTIMPDHHTGILRAAGSLMLTCQETASQRITRFDKSVLSYFDLPRTFPHNFDLSLYRRLATPCSRLEMQTARSIPSQ
jgi:hypothetical protein